MHQKETVGVTELLLSSLLNLMSLRDGQTFKGQLRLLGTLDHVASLGLLPREYNRITYIFVCTTNVALSALLCKTLYIRQLLAYII